MRNGARKPTNQNLYGKSGSSVHNMAQKLLNRCINTTKRGRDLPKTATLIILIVNIFDTKDKEYSASDTPKIRKFILLLKKSDPKILFKKEIAI